MKVRAGKPRPDIGQGRSSVVGRRSSPPPSLPYHEGDPHQEQNAYQGVEGGPAGQVAPPGDVTVEVEHRQDTGQVGEDLGGANGDLTQMGGELLRALGEVGGQGQGHQHGHTQDEGETAQI